MEAEIAIGLCACGCGRKTTISRYNDARHGWVKGQPVRYISGHNRVKCRPPSQSISIEGVICQTIPLTRGLEAIVNTFDYARLCVYRWRAVPARKGKWYAVRTDCGNDRANLFMHQLVLPVGEGKRPDHINGNGLDNRLCNLRPATMLQNAHNRDKNSNNKTGYIGVTVYKPMKDKYMAGLRLDNTTKYLGLYDSPVEAAIARDAAVIYHRGATFGRLNFPVLAVMALSKILADGI